MVHAPLATFGIIIRFQPFWRSGLKKNGDQVPQVVGKSCTVELQCLCPQSVWHVFDFKNAAQNFGGWNTFDFCMGRYDCALVCKTQNKGLWVWWIKLTPKKMLSTTLGSFGGASGCERYVGLCKGKWCPYGSNGIPPLPLRYSHGMTHFFGGYMPKTVTMYRSYALDIGGAKVGEGYCWLRDPDISRVVTCQVLGSAQLGQLIWYCAQCSPSSFLVGYGQGWVLPRTCVISPQNVHDTVTSNCSIQSLFHWLLHILSPEPNLCPESFIGPAIPETDLHLLYRGSDAAGAEMQHFWGQEGAPASICFATPRVQPFHKSNFDNWKTGNTSHFNVKSKPYIFWPANPIHLVRAVWQGITQDSCPLGVGFL